MIWRCHDGMRQVFSIDFDWILAIFSELIVSIALVIDRNQNRFAWWQQWTISFQSQQTYSIIFFGDNPGFVILCCASFRFDHDLFAIEHYWTLLSYVKHFSSLVINFVKNCSILFHFSSDLQMEIWSIKFYSIKSCGNQHELLYVSSTQISKTILWSMFSFLAMS